MALRNLNFDVSINGIMPNMVNDAGIQGDHGVTRLNFMLTEEIYQEIIGSVTDGKVMYRFDLYDGEGGVWQSDALALVGRDVGITLQERHTRFGGKLTIYLVLTALTAEDKTEVELYNLPVMLQLKNRPAGVYQQGEDYESVISLVENAKRQVNMASSFAEESKNYNNQVREFAEEVETKLRNGEFDGIGIEEAKIVNDELIITYSNKITKNLGNIKGQKGEKGDKGDKGDTPDITNYYTKDEIGGMFSSVDGRLSEVDTHIDAVETTLINNYYTKTAIDAFDYANKKYVDDAIESINAGGTINLSNYYTKDEIANLNHVTTDALDNKLSNYSTINDVEAATDNLKYIATYAEAENGRSVVFDTSANPLYATKTRVEFNDFWGISVNTNTYTDDEGNTEKLPIHVGTSRIEGVGTPQSNTDAATKGYVDEAIIKVNTGGSVDLSNYYTKTEVDNVHASLDSSITYATNYSISVAQRLNSDYYTKAEIDTKIINGGSVDLSNYYTKAEADNVYANFDSRINEATNNSVSVVQRLNSDYYTKAEVNTLVGDIESLLGGI